MTKDSIISIIKGAGIAGAGAALTYIMSYISNADFGQSTPIVVMAWSVVVNVVRKYIADRGEEKAM